MSRKEPFDPDFPAFGQDFVPPTSLEDIEDRLDQIQADLFEQREMLKQIRFAAVAVFFACGFAIGKYYGWH